MNHYYQLTLEQRYQISAMKETGATQKAIATKLGVSPATISREVRRNQRRGRYSPQAAHDLSCERRRTAKKFVRITSEIWALVEKMIQLEWSPEQISGRLKKESNILISHERIYEHVRWDRAQGGDLYTHLRQGFKRRRKYGKVDLRGHIRDRVSIEQRPQIVDQKGRIGDWEIDTVYGKPRSAALVTVVERVSKVTRMGKAARRKAKDVRETAVARLAVYQDLVETITADNGKEFAEHKAMGQALGAQVFFAHPYSAWERGLNENTNGLVRQYFPKGTDFDEIEPWEIQWVEDRLNNRPRKSLGYATPNEILTEARKLPGST